VLLNTQIACEFPEQNSEDDYSTRTAGFPRHTAPIARRASLAQKLDSSDQSIPKEEHTVAPVRKYSAPCRMPVKSSYYRIWIFDMGNIFFPANIFYLQTKYKLILHKIVKDLNR